MNERNKLTFCMAFLFFFVIVGFGSIVIEEKKISLVLPKAQKKITNYIKDKYSDEKKEFKVSKTKYDLKCNCYKSKVTNKINNNLYFYVTYKQKKIKDTYVNDYKKGIVLLSDIEKKLTNELQNLNKDQQGNKDKTLKVKINKTLDKFNPSIKNDILTTKNIKSLNI